MELSTHQKERIALATLGLERAKVGIYNFDIERGGAWKVGLSIQRLGSGYFDHVAIVTVNYEQIDEYQSAITAYLDELYTERK